MAELRFQVKGNKSKPFEVMFRKSGSNLTALCSCESGNSDLCQHRIKIMTGSAEDVVSKNAEEVKTVTAWIAGSDVGKALHGFLEAIKRLEIAQEDYDNARKDLINSMRD